MGILGQAGRHLHGESYLFEIPLAVATLRPMTLEALGVRCQKRLLEVLGDEFNER